jgi:hypothetical protein
MSYPLPEHELVALAIQRANELIAKWSAVHGDRFAQTQTHATWDPVEYAVDVERPVPPDERRWWRIVDLRLVAQVAEGRPCPVVIVWELDVS